MAASSLLAPWRSLRERFKTKTRRERILVAVASMAVVLYGGYALWLEPAQTERKRLQDRLAELQGEAQQVANTLAALRAQQEPDAANRRRLADLENQVAIQRQRLVETQERLVPPEQAIAFLRQVLDEQRGVKLVALKTLSPQPLFTEEREDAAATTASSTSETQRTPSATASSLASAANLYRHGIEITLAGSYLDLLAYLGKVGEGPRRFLWGEARLVSERYPTCLLTMKLYTLSLEPTWLAL